MLYFGDANGSLYLRTAAAAGGPTAPFPTGTAAAPATYAGGAPVDIAIRPDDWHVAYVTDGAIVFRTLDPGATAFADVTGNLAALGVTQINAMTIVPGTSAAMGDGILAATNIGVFAMRTRALGAWAPFSTTMPNTSAFDIVYDATDDVGVVATIGRGVWKLKGARDAVFGDSHLNFGDGHLYGSAPDDQTFTVAVPVSASLGRTTANVTLPGSAGQLTQTVTVGWVAQTTSAIPWGAPTEGVKSALEELTKVGVGNVDVTTPAPAATTLGGGISDTDTSLTVADGSGFPATSFQIRIDGEVILVASRSGNTLSGLTRGQGGTTAASHQKDAPGTDADNVSSSHASDGLGHSVWTITFTKGKGHQDVQQLVGETADENRVDVGVLGSALSHGKFLSDPGLPAGQRGTADNPATGFIFGTLAGGLGFSGNVKPDGALAGLADDLSAKLDFTATSGDWFRNPPLQLAAGESTLSGALDDSATTLTVADGSSFPASHIQVVIDNDVIHVGSRSGNTFNGLTRGTKGTAPAAHADGVAVPADGVHFHFQGPDFDALINRFKNLDFASILQAIRTLLDFVKTIDGPTRSGIAKVLDTKLPLVDRSVSEVLDIAGELADEIHAIAANPVGAIQQLSNLLAGTLGKTVPTVSSATTTGGTPTPAATRRCRPSP